MDAETPEEPGSHLHNSFVTLDRCTGARPNSQQRAAFDQEQ